MQKIEFSNRPDQHKLFATLKLQVETLVSGLGHERQWRLQVRAILMMLSYISLYALALLTKSHLVVYFLCFQLMGLLVVPIFLNVIHEAVHHNLFKNRKYNNAVLTFFDFIGVNSFIWKRRHNMLHHSFQNIPGWDSDIEQANVMRIYPQDEKKGYHRFQHYYMFLLYPLYLVNWVFIRDFRDYFRNRQIIRRVTKIPRPQYLKFFLFKSLFIGYTTLLPWLLGVPGLIAVGTMFAMVVTASVFALVVLLTPHVNISNQFPPPSEEGLVPFGWLEHQFQTTNDVNMNNWFSRNVMGNFNLHIAHHLFPHVSNVFAQEVTRVIRDFSKEHGFEYKTYSMWEALRLHYCLIKSNAVNTNVFQEDM